MTAPKTPAPANGRTAGLAHENRNTEQDERGEQAQDVARDAVDAETARAGGTESRKAPSPGVDNVAGNETDLVDIMRRMEDTGAIDNSAFAGEPDHDDEPTRYHDSGEEEDEDEDDADPDDLHETDRP